MNAKEDPLEKWRVKYGTTFVAQNIELPQDVSKTPKILGWSGPARSGTTALLFLLAGHPEVGRVFFQPQKTLMRLGGPRVVLNASDSLVCMKEVFFSLDEVNELEDPIDTLLKAGVPAGKITWVFMLRDPQQTFASWCKIARDVSVGLEPATYYMWQNHTINLWRKYKNSEVKVVPFVYELLRSQEELATRRLLTAVGFKDASLNLVFNAELIEEKFVPGQAADKDYFRKHIGTSLIRKEYRYSPNSYVIDSALAREVVALCQQEYENFAAEAMRIFRMFYT